MKPSLATSSTFDRPKLLLFRFLAHQIHPFAYAVNTFLQPALEDCRALLHQNPQDTFHILLSLTQTFIRFAPDSELIYDDIQQFASKLKDAIDECFLWIESDAIQQSSQVLESIHQSLSAIIQQQHSDNTTYTNLYKNMSAVLTNLQKINSLPVEIQILSLNDQSLSTTIPIQQTTTPDTSLHTNGHSIPHSPMNDPSSTNQFQSFPPPSTLVTKSSIKQVLPSIPTSTNTNVTLASAIQSSSQSISMSSHLYDYEIMDTITRSIQKPTASLAAFPPRHISREIELDNDQYDTPSNEDVPRELTESVESFNHHEAASDDDEKAREYYLDLRFTDPCVADAVWHPVRDQLSVLFEQSHFDLTTAVKYSHVTDNYFQEFGDKPSRPSLRGEHWMTYGTPQTSSQTTCLPIGVGLSYDELTLLSCDVHRSSQNIRLFDIQSGQLKHTITSNQQMKFHRPSAVMSNPRNNILIVERDYIYVTEPDGRLVQTIGHRSIKQLYGVALFRDRYLLTIDSKATDNQTAENSRLLLFDPNSGQLVFEQHIVINRESEEILQQQNINHIQGKILPEATSKPRFLAVNNDQIYIADLGRSLIYGTSIRNEFDFSCTTVFGGQGRSHGEMNDPSGLFVDTAGNVISADSKNDRIQVFSSDGEYRTTLKLNERIKRPSGICTNRAGTKFYISCYLAGCVRAFDIGY